MNMELIKEFTFEAAHRLPNLPPEHKCSRLHGHSYNVKVEVTGPLQEDFGWVVDFGDIKSAWRELDEALDHRYLNEIPGLENPTSEVLSIWIWDRLKGNLAGLLSAVTVQETCTSGCTYRG
jgi:6-pyruvoyltetrahydropterin/6-carboxytetrahydropterin synthase